VKKTLLFTIAIAIGCCIFFLSKINHTHTTAKTGLKVFDFPSRIYTGQAESIKLAHYITGCIYLNKAEFDKAILHYEQALKYVPSEAFEPVSLRLAAGYFYKGDKAKAFEIIETVVEKNPDSKDAHSLLAFLYTSENQLDKAEKEYRKVIELSPTDVSANILGSLADLYVFQNKPQEALEVYNQLIEKFPENRQLYVNKAIILANIKSIDSAIKEAKKVIDADEKNEEGYALLGILYEMNDQLPEASEAYKKALEIEPADLLVYQRLAGVYVLLKRFDDAVNQCNILIKLDPYNAKNYLDLALVYFFKKDFDKALNTITTALVAGLYDQRLYFARGFLYFFCKQDYNLAIDSFTESLKIKPDNKEAYFYLAVIYDKIGNTEKVYENLKKAIYYAPDMAKAYNYLSYRYAEAGINLDEALEMAKKAIELEPDNAAFLDTIGWVFYKRGELPEAKKFLEEAVLLENDPVINEHLGDVYNSLGMFKEALKYWEISVSLNKENKSLIDKIEQLKNSTNSNN